MAILFAMPGMAQTVALEEITEAVPGPVTVDLTFSNLTNVGAITLYIEYDDVLLGYSGPSQMTFLGSTMLINTMSNHRLGLSWFNTTGQNIITAVIPLQFDYLGGFSSDFHFMPDCEIATNTGALIDATYIDGSIENHEWTDIDGAVGFYWYDAEVGEQMVIPLLREGYTSGPVSFEEVSSITLFIEFDPAMLTYQGVANNIHGFSVSQSNGLLSLTWSSVDEEDFRDFDEFLDLLFTYNGGTAGLYFQSGSMVTSGTEILTTYFVDSYIFPEAAAANLTISNVVSPGAAFELVPPTNDTLWLPVQVQVPVTASGITSSAGAIAINMVYDADKLTYTGYSAGSLSGWTVSHSEGQLSFLKTNASGMAIPDGTLFTLKFDYLTGLAPIEFRPGTFLQEPDLDFIPVNLNNGWVSTGSTISGYVTYDNIASTPLNNCTVTLKQGLTTVATTSTNGSGYYEFNLVENGTYSIAVSTTMPWSNLGVDIDDLSAMLSHILNVSPISGLRLIAGDVLDQNSIDVDDVSSVMTRILAMPGWIFDRGDWVFENPTVVISSNNETVNIKGLLAGDVDGSYIPQP